MKFQMMKRRVKATGMYRLLIDTAISDSTVNILGLGCIKSIIRKDEQENRGSSSLLALVLGMVSALCWWRSSVVAVPHAHAKGSGLFYDGTVAVDGADLFKTLRAQARWSRWGATLANHWNNEAQRDRNKGGTEVNVGRISAEANAAYDGDPIRYRYGKRVRGVVASKLQAHLGRNVDIVQASPALSVSD
ncbi:hypothetical protein [Herbaspirillum huttiense]|uniref:hypothetical protein n=1 Tax=Herbaspirillum huttiense TaxID=863372 RepID=UPI0039AF6C9B